MSFLDYLTYLFGPANATPTFNPPKSGMPGSFYFRTSHTRPKKHTNRLHASKKARRRHKRN